MIAVKNPNIEYVADGIVIQIGEEHAGNNWYAHVVGLRAKVIGRYKTTGDLYVRIEAGQTGPYGNVYPQDHYAIHPVDAISIEGITNKDGALLLDKEE